MADLDFRARTIKSFVRRGGRVTASQRHALDYLWPRYGIEYADSRLCLPFDLPSLKLEIGIGNGDALIEMAAGDPQSLYLGIEVHEAGIGRCLNGLARRELTNVRLLKHDAVEVLQQMITPATLDRVLLFFPDPWHKKRHHKRRIVNSGFRNLLYCGLKQGGVIHIVTDWQDYAESIAAQFLSDARFVNNGNASGYAERPAYRPPTRFERRGLALGHEVWDMLFTKISDSS